MTATAAQKLETGEYRCATCNALTPDGKSGLWGKGEHYRIGYTDLCPEHYALEMKLTEAKAGDAFYTNLVAEAREAITSGYGDDSIHDAVSAYALIAAPHTMTVGELREAMENATAEAIHNAGTGRDAEYMAG